MKNYIFGLLAALIALAIAAVALISWTAVAVFLIICVSVCTLAIVDRLHPKAEALPTADDILKEVNEHKLQTTTELERLRGLVSMGARANTRLLRE